MKDGSSNFDNGFDKNNIKKMIEDAKNVAKGLGGFKAFKSGEFLLSLIQKSFKNYWENANAEYFGDKYKINDEEFLSNKLCISFIG
jgi:hypothetical protein